MEDTRSNDIQIAVEAAMAGGRIVAENFGASPDPDYKGKFDPVTEIDRASERAVLSVIRSNRPDDEVMAEESGGRQHSGRHWIVDPLDGTVNFVHGIPQVSVSVALYEGDVGIAGVVYDPLRRELFTATSGGGAYLNGDAIKVSDTQVLERSVITTGFPYDHDVKAEELAVVVREVLKHVNGLRRFGSAALDLAWVAAGRFDGYWELGIEPWDGAAGLILVREAGGIVTDPHGRESTPSLGRVIATNPSIHESLRRVIKEWMP